MTMAESHAEATWTAVDTEQLRELVASEDARQWQIGDLLLAHLPKGRHGVNTGVKAEISRIAAMVGAEPASLRLYRDVAHGWPDSTRVESATWSAHRAYMGSPDSAADRRETLLSLPRNEHGYITKQAVRNLTKGAGGKNLSWGEAIGQVGDDLIKAEKDMTKFEKLIGEKDPVDHVREKASRYAQWADELAQRLRAFAG